MADHKPTPTAGTTVTPDPFADARDEGESFKSASSTSMKKRPRRDEEDNVGEENSFFLSRSAFKAGVEKYNEVSNSYYTLSIYTQIYRYHLKRIKLYIGQNFVQKGVLDMRGDHKHKWYIYVYHIINLQGYIACYFSFRKKSIFFLSMCRRT